MFEANSSKTSKYVAKYLDEILHVEAERLKLFGDDILNGKRGIIQRVYWEIGVGR